jgi:hypothetical protein
MDQYLDFGLPLQTVYVTRSQFEILKKAKNGATVVNGGLSHSETQEIIPLVHTFPYPGGFNNVRFIPNNDMAGLLERPQLW